MSVSSEKFCPAYPVKAHTGLLKRLLPAVSNSIDGRSKVFEEIMSLIEDIKENPKSHGARTIRSEKIYLALYKFHIEPVREQKKKEEVVVHQEECKLEETGKKMVEDHLFHLFPHLVNGLSQAQDTPPEYGPYILALRSGAEFFFETFKDSYAKAGRHTQREISLCEYWLDIWTDKLLMWKEREFDLFDVYFDPEVFVRPPGIPDSHVWWKDPY